MILADTSVWVAHLKHPKGHPELIAALEDGLVTTHPLVEGELALSGARIDVLLAGVPLLPASPHAEVLEWVVRLSREARGIGWVDAHLVHAAVVNGQALLTLDRAQGEFYRRIVRPGAP